MVETSPYKIVYNPYHLYMPSYRFTSFSYPRSKVFPYNSTVKYLDYHPYPFGSEMVQYDYGAGKKSDTQPEIITPVPETVTDSGDGISMNMLLVIVAIIVTFIFLSRRR